MAQLENVPVVLVHGWGGSFRNTWKKPGIDALLEDIGRQVIGIDLLGHGDSEKPHTPDAYAHLSDWLVDQLPSSYSQVDIVGFSLGALTALDALVSHPTRFRKVVLAGIGNGVFEASHPERNRRIVDALEGNGPDDDTFSLMFVQYANQPGNDRVALTAIMKRPLHQTVTKDQLQQLPHDVLVVIGDNDFTAPADRLADAFPNGSLCILKNTDHFATTESFSFIDALLDFLTS